MNFDPKAIAAAATAGTVAFKTFDNYYNNYASKTIGFTEDNLDYPGSIDIFNGLEMIGGDGAKYKAAIKDFKSFEEAVHYLVVTVVTIVLEKPAGVIFSGLTGPQKAKCNELANRQKEAMNAMITILPALANLYDQEKDAGKKEGVIDNAIVSIQSYLIAKPKNSEGEFDGYMIEGSADELKVPNSFHRALTAKLNTMKARIGAGSHFAQIDRDAIKTMVEEAKIVAMDEKAADFLPKMTEAEYKSRDPSDLAKMDKTRANWLPAFRRVNVSRAKVMALMALQYQEALYPIQRDWVNKYGGRPHKAKCPESTNDQTKAIWKKNMDKFKEDKALYRDEAKKTFAKIGKRAALGGLIMVSEKAQKVNEDSEGAAPPEEDTPSETAAAASAAAASLGI